MLPIRDLNPSRTTPIVTWLIIGVAVLVYFFVQQGSDAYLYEAASIPCEITTGSALSPVEINGAPCQEGGQPVFPAKNVWFSIIASIFFHASVVHLAFNMWAFLIFGNNVEDAFGHGGYLVFYLIAGVVASAAHIVIRPESTLPVVGASGAIAGVMGAYAVLFPRARVTSIVPPFFFWPFALPAFLFLIIWFGSQFLLAGQDTNVAWEAHVAGFGFGVLVGLLGRSRLQAHSTAVDTRVPIGRIYRSS